MTLQSSFYRRPLPSQCIDFSSPEGRKLFKESLEAGFLEGYFSLAANFTTQQEPAYCGLGTLAMVLNSLQIDPDRIWKGPWRWFSEELLDCCTPLEVVQQNGITFEEFACLAGCNGAKAIITRPSSSSIEVFRETIKRVTSFDDERLVVSYDRQILGQTGSGHFSPIGAYHPASDSVLVLDVARFKYPPHWVSLETLWKALFTIDDVTGKERGFAVLSKGHSSVAKVLRITAGRSDWEKVANQFCDDLLKNCTQNPPSSIQEFFKIVVRSLDNESLRFFTSYLDNYDTLSSEHQLFILEVFKGVYETKVYQLFSQALKEKNEANKSDNEANNCTINLQPFGYAEIATIFLLSQPVSKCVVMKPQLISELQQLIDISELRPQLRNEVIMIKSVLDHLETCCAVMSTNAKETTDSIQSLSPAKSEKKSCSKCKSR